MLIVAERGQRADRGPYAMTRDIDLSTFTEEELLSVNRRIVERLKLMQHARADDERNVIAFNKRP